MTDVWLSLLHLNTSNPTVRRDLGNAVNLHRRLMRLFPDNLGDNPRHNLGILFRLEDTPRGPRVLLQSQQSPNHHTLPNDYGTCQTKPLTPLLDALQPGHAVHYRLTANAIRKPGKTTRQARNLSPVMPLTGPDAEQWWHRQAESAGLELTTVHATPLDPARGKKHPSQPDIRHDRTLFDGTATITNPDQLRQRLTHGIGRGKPYGCGLLTIAPTKHTP